MDIIAGSPSGLHINTCEDDMIFQLNAGHTRASSGVLALAVGLAIVAGAHGTCTAQAVKGAPPEDAPPPALTYRGLTPGVSSVADVREALGEPVHEARWYAWKMLYAAADRPGLFDAIHLQSASPDEGVVGNIEAASVPAGYETRDAVRAKLAEPEFHLELSRQSLDDYSERGVRFVYDAAGKTIGVAYFPHGYPRVHAGQPRRGSLRHLRQGPQKARAERPRDADGANDKDASEKPTLWCGTGEADISPREPDWLGPVKFTVADPLAARAVVLASEETAVAIVGADIFGMLKADVDRIEERLRKRGIDHLLLAMSHCHTAGDPIGIYGHYPAEYVSAIQDGVYEAALAAYRTRRPVRTVLAASDELALDGARVQGLFRNARNPGIVDPQLAVVQVRGEEDDVLATLVHFACHVEGIESPEDGPRTISADFPGVLAKTLSERTGAPVAFLNGAVGGMVSGDTRARTREEARIAGERLAAEAERVLGFAVPVGTSLSYRRARLEIPVTNPKMILFEKLSGRKSFYRGRAVTELYHLRLGDAEILAVPGELLPEISFEIQARMHGYPRLITGLANDQIGYLIPAYDFRRESYEESMSLGPAAGPLVKEAALRLVESE